MTMNERGWCWQELGGVGWWRAEPLELFGVGAVFASRRGGVSPPPYDTLNQGGSGGDDPRRVAENRARFARAAGFALDASARVRQVHGAAVCLARAPGDYGEADALIATGSDAVLTVLVADCAAIQLLDPGRRAIGLCHAGWRGVVADAPGAAVRALRDTYGSDPGGLWAAVGPCIGACCYEVDRPVTQALRAAVPWADAVLSPVDAIHARFDLAEANRLRLLDAGLEPSRIHLAGICTACHPDRLFSYRRDGRRSGRMLAAIWTP